MPVLFEGRRRSVCGRQAVPQRRSPRVQAIPRSIRTLTRSSAAEAALAAQAQGKFWEMHDRMYAGFPDLSRRTVMRYAKEIGLDVNRFTARRGQPQVPGASPCGGAGRRSCRGGRYARFSLSTVRNTTEFSTWRRSPRFYQERIEVIAQHAATFYHGRFCVWRSPLPFPFRTSASGWRRHFHSCGGRSRQDNAILWRPPWSGTERRRLGRVLSPRMGWSRICMTPRDRSRVSPSLTFQEVAPWH